MDIFGVAHRCRSCCTCTHPLPRTCADRLRFARHGWDTPSDLRLVNPTARAAASEHVLPPVRRGGGSAALLALTLLDGRTAVESSNEDAGPQPVGHMENMLWRYPHRSGVACGRYIHSNSTEGGLCATGPTLLQSCWERVPEIRLAPPHRWLAMLTAPTLY